MSDPYSRLDPDEFHSSPPLRAETQPLYDPHIPRSPTQMDPRRTPSPGHPLAGYHRRDDSYSPPSRSNTAGYPTHHQMPDFPSEDRLAGQPTVSNVSSSNCIPLFATHSSLPVHSIIARILIKDSTLWIISPIRIIVKTQAELSVLQSTQMSMPKRTSMIHTIPQYQKTPTLSNNSIQTHREGLAMVMTTTTRSSPAILQR